MRLIQRTNLEFRQGSSDKVYEVDLCEAGPERFVVNFRFGRRGSALKEGTKTAAPVARAEAERLFQALVAEKTKKGYWQTMSPVPQVAPDAPTRTFTFDAEKRKQFILDRLQAAPPPARPLPQVDSRRSWQRPRRPKQAKGEWPIERVIWRAGELQITEAAPLLPKFVGTGDAVRDYCVAWSLGWCGAGNEAARTTLENLYRDEKKSEAVRRIAGEALLKLADEPTRLRFQVELAHTLPQPLNNLALAGSSERFASALRVYLEKGTLKRGQILEKLYIIDNPIVRPALLDELRRAPLRPGFFKPLRHVFKMAEYRRDAQVFGILAYRFETGKEMYASNYWSTQVGVYVDGRYYRENLSNLSNDEAKIAYGSKTREYLRRRAWRTLRRVGELGDAETYVRLAVGTLLPFTDADADAPRKSVFTTYYNKETRRYDWRNPQHRTTHYDTNARLNLLNHIIYGHSTRYAPAANDLIWKCVSGYEAGRPAPNLREEAFPKLWEAQPVGLLHLLAESQNQRVHEFAAHVLRDCPEFTATFDVDVLLMLLGRPYAVTAQLGFELAQKNFARLAARLDQANEAFRLALAVALCAHTDARREGQRWLENWRTRFVKDLNAVTATLTSPYADARAWGLQMLQRNGLTEDDKAATSQHLLSVMAGLREGQQDVARSLTDTLTQVFASALRETDWPTVRGLLAHPWAEVQELGALILLNHAVPVAQQPSDLLNVLLASPFEAVRALGVQLFGQLPDEVLKRRVSTHIALLTHELADLSQAARPTVHRLAVADAGFAKQITQDLLSAMLRPEPTDGAHTRLLEILRAEVPHWETHTTPTLARQLAHATAPAAAEAGGHLLQTHAVTWQDEFSTDDIIDLAAHEIVAVRLGACALAQAGRRRFTVQTNGFAAHAEVAKLTRALDLRWADGREFWFEFFRNALTAKELTPDVLVGISDSPKPEVQAFGRELLLKYFRDEDGVSYLLRLSEHPSADMQLFVTNYLENYATDAPERLAQLTPYFVSVLSLVNRGRVAKNRVLQFLAQEAAKSLTAAQIVATILARQSATTAIGDRAAMLEAMLALKKQYPALSLPIKVQAVRQVNAVVQGQ